MPDGMLVYLRVTPSISSVGVKCLTQEHNTMTPARANEPGALNLESHLLTIDRALYVKLTCMHF